MKHHRENFPSAKDWIYQGVWLFKHSRVQSLHCPGAEKVGDDNRFFPRMTRNINMNNIHGYIWHTQSHQQVLFGDNIHHPSMVVLGIGCNWVYHLILNDWRLMFPGIFCQLWPIWLGNIENFESIYVSYWHDAKENAKTIEVLPFLIQGTISF